MFEVTGLDDPAIWDSLSMIADVGPEGLGKVAVLMDEISEAEVVEEARDMDHGEYIARATDPEDEVYDAIEVALGTKTNATEIVKALFEYYNYEGIFKHFTESQVLELHKQMMDPNLKFFRKLNKQMELAPVLMVNQHQLSKDTFDRYREFIKISLAASVVASLGTELDLKGSTLPKDTLQKRMALEGYDVKNMKKNIMQRMAKAGYVKTKDDGESWSDERQIALFNEIVDRRGEAPLTPFDLNFFTEDQQKELKALYIQVLPVDDQGDFKYRGGIAY
jgi:hypothetical protein